MAKKQPPRSLAEQLKAAGFATEARAVDAERARRDEAQASAHRRLVEGRATGTAVGISDYYLALETPPDSFDASLGWAARWYDEVRLAGHGELLDDLGLERPRRVHAPELASTIASLESTLGFDLPPSLRSFFSEVGAARLGPRGSETIRAADVPRHLEPLRTVLGELVTRRAELRPYAQALHLIPCHTLDGNYDFVLRNARDSAGESPVYFAYHDDDALYGGDPGMNRWLATKLATMVERFRDAAANRVRS